MHNNISFFIPHLGCPHCCSFCSQTKISGQEKIPTTDEVRDTCKRALSEIKNLKDTEIAFFGGSFTAIDRSLMISYLEAANEFVGEDKFFGIRVSTRPDAIDDEIIAILKKYNVTSVELGAQSMCDDVLLKNERGHSAQQVEKASELIKNAGISLGLQMMTGLYGTTVEKDILTAEKIADLKPETVRIYPTVVLENTKLVDIYRLGIYEMISFEEMCKLCGKLLEFFESRNIHVIKCGLHSEENVEKNMVAGYYHPAFREICESYIYREKMQKLINENPDRKEYIFCVNKSDVSKAVGQKKSNRIYFENKGIKIKIKGSIEKENKYFCMLENGLECI
jgi:histone acetyltransferase (RNA polymerase elongator complex component)